MIRQRELNSTFFKRKLNRKDGNDIQTDHFFNFSWTSSHIGVWKLISFWFSCTVLICCNLRKAATWKDSTRAHSSPLSLIPNLRSLSLSRKSKKTLASLIQPPFSFSKAVAAITGHRVISKENPKVHRSWRTIHSIKESQRAFLKGLPREEPNS